MRPLKSRRPGRKPLRLMLLRRPSRSRRTTCRPRSSRRRKRSLPPKRARNDTASKDAPAPKEARATAPPPPDAGTKASAEAGEFAVQVAALNARSEADAIARRLTAKGYAAYVVSPANGTVDVPRARRHISRHAAKPNRWPPGCKKKSSSNPGLLASDRLRALLLAFSFPKFGHPAFALDRARAAARRAAYRHARSRRAFALGLVTGGVYFTGTLYWITRVMVLYGNLQTWVAVLVNAALVAYLALYPGLFALIVRRLIAIVRARSRCSRRRWSGWRRSSDARTCSPAFPGCCSATARRRCCRSRSWPASSASSACRAWSRP